jgi:hypothetical protein
MSRRVTQLVEPARLLEAILVAHVVDDPTVLERIGRVLVSREAAHLFDLIRADPDWAGQDLVSLAGVDCNLRWALREMTEEFADRVMALAELAASPRSALGLAA